MPNLPTGQEIQQILRRMDEGNHNNHGRWPTAANAAGTAQTATMKSMAPATFVVQSGVTHAASAAGHVPVALQIGAVGGSSVASFGGVGAAVGPWLSAGAIALTAGKYYALCDLQSCAEGKYRGVDVPYRYTCKCGKCAENLEYIVAKEQTWMGCKALSAFTMGVSAMGKAAFELGKGPLIRALGKERQSHQISKNIVQSARDSCEVAIATVFLFSDKWTPVDRSEHVISWTLEVIINNDWIKVQRGWASCSK